MPQRITVIGSANTDLIMQVPRLPAVGETVSDGLFSQAAGGKGANQAVTAARAGGDVAFVCGVGADAPGRDTLANLYAEGVATTHAFVSPDAPTGCALILVDREGRNSIAVAPGANHRLGPEHVEAAQQLLRGSALIVMQTEIPADTARRALEIASESGVPVLFNFAPVREDRPALSPAMTTLVVNEVEAEALAGLPVRTPEQAAEAAERLQAQGPSTVIVTLGAAGAWARGPDWQGHVPAFSAEAVDTTAAGDVFCGALAVALVEGRPLADAARFASAASALSVTRLGAQPSIPRRDEIEAFLNSPKVSGY